MSPGDGPFVEGKPPATKEQELAFLRACCRSLMANDNPCSFTQAEREALEEFTNELAQLNGYEGWIDAFHQCKE